MALLPPQPKLWLEPATQRLIAVSVGGVPSGYAPRRPLCDPLECPNFPETLTGAIHGQRIR